MTLEQVKRLKHLNETNYGDMTFYEYNQRTNGLPRKYVWIFNANGENITRMISFVLDRKTSRSQRFFGAIMTTGYGFYFAGYLQEYLKNKNYRNENDIRFDYFIKNGPS